MHLFQVKDNLLSVFYLNISNKIIEQRKFLKIQEILNYHHNNVVKNTAQFASKNIIEQ